jgi:hypothetical protein
MADTVRYDVKKRVFLGFTAAHPALCCVPGVEGSKLVTRSCSVDADASK